MPRRRPRNRNHLQSQVQLNREYPEYGFVEKKPGTNFELGQLGALQGPGQGNSTPSAMSSRHVQNMSNGGTGLSSTKRKRLSPRNLKRLLAFKARKEAEVCLNKCPQSGLENLVVSPQLPQTSPGIASLNNSNLTEQNEKTGSKNILSLPIQDFENSTSPVTMKTDIDSTFCTSPKEEKIQLSERNSNANSSLEDKSHSGIELNLTKHLIPGVQETQIKKRKSKNQLARQRQRPHRQQRELAKAMAIKMMDSITTPSKSQSPYHLIKENPEFKPYWVQRHKFFSKFNEGIKLDDLESWCSVTPEKIAIEIAERSCNSETVIIDGFCGCGGNTIQFAKICKKVYAIDIDKVKLENAKHNAKIYGIDESKITCINNDFLDLAPALKADIVFLSPPWGGPGYKSMKVFDLKAMPLDGIKIFELARSIASKVIYFVPRNVDESQLKELAGEDSLRIETNYLYNNKPHSITAYYGFHNDD